MERAPSIRSRLEPTDNELLEDAAKFSTAISLKRIADALEKLAVRRSLIDEILQERKVDRPK